MSRRDVFYTTVWVLSAVVFFTLVTVVGRLAYLAVTR